MTKFKNPFTNQSKKPYTRRTKYCTYCNNEINETDFQQPYILFMTKRADTIMEFKSFHENCWKDFILKSIEYEINDRKKKGLI
ncbi:hypothetical protein GOV12_01515 [Candidatus Pacearchaeota archaeon]|nr:hypothetical protein [Candidatus Pacearchaeota archaeon]